MNDTLPSTSYVSRVLPLAIGVAEQVFDTCCADRSAATSAVRPLLLHDAVVATPMSRISPVRVCRGELRLGRLGRRVAVELELSVWSRTQSELGLRLVGRRRVPGRYSDAAIAVVDALASELELRGLLATHPAHAAGTSRQPMAVSAWL